MKNFIIASFIKNLSFNDFNNYLITQKIVINNDLSYNFYNILKNNYQDIINRPTYYLDIIKKNVDSSTYNKIYELYTTYSKKLYH